ncbi:MULTISPECIES: hypothetical protein [unclassified Exiguobacterium]|uniref:hypothetical protein n=1 Tax=unclassified Exiguobacterium TaxID=2644629 RepID=UPI00103BF838|nr:MULTISPECIES: hypothetical protein [unclassified Exiguobacterium]TCI67989.1 hypothetical protein EVJ19_11965 [Exiguobacterium sp. IPCI3]TCI77406.1 hypothetical protein EVJ18_11955 [Exiguobacterium sp. IPCH1]TCI78884.1 hypothetical protein EVJ17_11955 [Exiguobacterium sp. IPBC4]
MDSYQLDQQTMDEMTEVLLRRLPDRLQEDFDDLKLVSMDLLCDVKEGERLTNLTVFFNTNMIRRNRRT